MVSYPLPRHCLSSAEVHDYGCVTLVVLVRWGHPILKEAVMAPPRTDPIPRFWSRVNKTETCWLWTGYVAPSGYGEFWPHSYKVNVHRFSYELAYGPIPEGLQIDHLCRTPHCVRPDHMETVTGRENTLRGIGPSAINARKTHCLNGHSLDLVNTYVFRGARHCRICRKLRQRDYVSRRQSLAS